MYKGENEILNSLKTGKKTIEGLSNETGLNADTIRRALESLKEQGAVLIDVEETWKVVPTEEFGEYANKGEMPEYAVFKKALNNALVSELSENEKSIGIRWAKIKGFIDIVNGRLVPKVKATHANLENSRLISAYSGHWDNALETELLKRGLMQKQGKKITYVTFTGNGIALPPSNGGFDINAASKDATIGKTHPLSKMTKQIKQIFAELGFEEMNGSAIETAFWNFDSLFQPQDHPARELADTFYIDGEGELPEDKKLVERVKKSHEQGWKYKWSENEAKRLVLRTHTTALSARYLAALGNDKTPKKYFAVGRVFRNEATDFKHLAEFHQVEGIIAWENAKFTDLLGILREFYKKLGFEKIRFVPSYFPYTEPSLQVEVYFEPRKQWLELGGAGIFRPEVSQPLCGIYPVLAWGLSLERPLMMLMELEDIRTFYKNDLEWLRGARL